MLSEGSHTPTAAFLAITQHLGLPFSPCAATLLPAGTWAAVLEPHPRNGAVVTLLPTLPAAWAPSSPPTA